MPVLNRKAQGLTHIPDDAPFDDRDFQSKWPTLFDYMFQTTWEDGTLRQTATLMFFAEGVVLKGVLNDRAFARSVFVTSATFSGILDTLEEGLLRNNLDWRQRKNYNGNSSSTPF